MAHSYLLDYNYDFNYSINFDHHKHPQKTFADQDERKQFIICSTKINDYKLIINRQIKTFFTLLMRQGSYLKLGKILTQLTEIEFELISKKNKSKNEVQNLRQQLCCCIAQTSNMLKKQKEYYLNLLILFIMLVILKIIHQKYQILLDRTVLFHFIHWEIKGQHSTNLFYQKLQQQVLRHDSINNYIQERNNNFNKIQQSLSFKDIKQEQNIQKSIQYKQTTLFASINHNFNKQNYQQNNIHPSYNCFKKPPSILTTNTSQSKIPNYPKTFSKCIITK